MFSALDIKTLMQGTLYGDPSLRVDTIRPIHSPLVGGLSIVMTPGDLLHIPTTGADIIIGPEEIISSNAKAKIVVDYLNVNNLNKVLRYYKVHKYRLFEQENTSTIPDVYIGKHCQIGMNCHFMPGVKIMNCVTIGDNVAIHANTVIKEGTIIGNDVIIDSNNSIGNYSFEYMADERDSYVRVDSIGRVIIGDDVEIMRRLLSAAYRIQQEPYRLLSKICFKKITMVLLHYFMARVSFMAHLIMLQLKLHN